MLNRLAVGGWAARAPRGLAALAGLALLLWLAVGAGRPWCLDDGLRLLAAGGPSLPHVADMGQVVNTSAPVAAPVFSDAISRATYPLISPFIHWQDGHPLLVFSPVYLGLLWLSQRLGPLGPPLLALLTGLLLAWAARRFLRGEPENGRGASVWLMGLLASPVLFYLGTSWEVGLTSVLLLLLLQERREPLPPAHALAYGLLPWLRPEALPLWLGGMFLLQGGTRRLLSLGGLVGGALLHRWLTGSWIWLQVVENVGWNSWNPASRLAAFWLPRAAGGWMWAGLAVLVLLVWTGWRGDSRGKTLAWLLALALALALVLTEATGLHPLLPCWGALLTAPLAVGALAQVAKREHRRDIVPEFTVLLAFLLAVSLASPVGMGFHWGPRLLIPALLPLGLWYLSREPAGWPRRLALGLALTAQALSLALLAGRHQLVARQNEALAMLQAPALLTSEIYVLGDHPFLAEGRLVFLPWGEAPARALVAGLKGRGVREIDLVTPPGHALAAFLEGTLDLEALAPPRMIPGGRLGHVLEWRRLRLP